MYHVLVVDDEKIGRDGISFLLKKSSYDFHIAEAQNGKVALEYIKNHPIDFLFTDIKMPFMDGIELIKNIKEMNYKIKTIILSGYNDFDYAKNAIKMGVSEYLLKPIDPHEFSLSLDTIIQEYENEKQLVLDSIYHTSLLKEHILTSLINGSPLDLIERKLGNKSINEYLKPYKRMMLLEFSDNFLGENLDIVEQLNKIIMIDYDYLNLNLQQSVLLFTCNDETQLAFIANQIILNISLTYKCRCYIGMSQEIHDLAKLQQIETNLDDLLDRRYLNPKKQFYKIENTTYENINTKTIEELIISMDEDLKIKDMTSLHNHFLTLQQIYITNDTLSIYYLKFLLSPLIQSFHNILSKSSSINIDCKLTCLYQSDKINETMNILFELIQETENIYAKQEVFIHKEIEAVKKYIYTHYNLDLSVDQLSDYVCLTPSYLSHIFKKETGENLSKFIKRVRMEKAKDMLENSYEKIVTVAVAVGYQNVSYFCQSFREYFGVSPQKFRSQGE